MIFQTMSCSVSLGEIGVGLAGSSNFAGQWRGTSEKSPCTRFPIARPGDIYVAPRVAWSCWVLPSVFRPLQNPASLSLPLRCFSVCGILQGEDCRATGSIEYD